MKKFLAVAVMLMIFALMNTTFAAQITGDGYCKGIRLWGKVRVVNSFPDLKVQQVTNFPDALGKWQFVTSGEDFTVQFVNSFPDIKIKFVNAFPGR